MGATVFWRKKLWLELRSVEFVALLRVLSILHMSVVMPMRWIAGKCANLADYDFGVAEMGLALDLMDNGMAKVAQDGQNGLNDNHMMTIFDPLHNGK